MRSGAVLLCTDAERFRSSDILSELNDERDAALTEKPLR